MADDQWTDEFGLTVYYRIQIRHDIAAQLKEALLDEELSSDELEDIIASMMHENNTVNVLDMDIDLVERDFVRAV